MKRFAVCLLLLSLFLVSCEQAPTEKEYTNTPSAGNSVNIKKTQIPTPLI